MKKNQFSSLFLLITLLFSSNVFGQTNATLSEENLSDNSIKNPPSLPKPDEKTDNKAPEKSNSALITGAKTDLIDNLLGGKKIASLMFDDQENSEINRAVDSLKNNQFYDPANSDSKDIKADPSQANQESEKSYIYLASLMYFTQKDWAIWINEQKITPKTNNRTEEIFVESIQKNQVRLVWKMSLTKWKVISGASPESPNPQVNSNNQVEFRFALRPNQTFSLNDSSVVEGKAVTAFLKKKEDDKKEETDKANSPQNLNIEKIQ